MIKRKSKHEYRIDLNPKYTHDELHEMLAWCKENFGEGGRNNKCLWRYGWITKNVKYVLYFRHEKHALFFCMRWT